MKLADVIADSIFDVKIHGELDGVASVYDKLLTCLANDNARFNENEFREYVSKQLKEKGI